jgi:putative sterol carrier protein
VWDQKVGDGVTKQPFLSEGWIEESRRIREEYRDRIPELTVSIKMNQIINDVPFGTGVIHAYVDTSSGRLEMETGQLDDPDLTLTLSYDTAKAILVDGDSQAAMSAFLGGRIKVDGDITKMLALQTAGAASAGNSSAVEMVQRIQEMTA